jgi:hypothetical protein
MNITPLFTAVLTVSLAAAAPAQNFAMSEELGAAVMSARRLAAAAPKSHGDFRATQADLATNPKGVASINAGFLALGAAGKTGTVRGLGFAGAYRVIQNDPAEMVFDMQTDFVAGRFTMKRDAATGKDLLGFEGQTKDGPFSQWTQSKGNYAGQITYNAGKDAGSISWQLNGQQIQDTYGGGRAGSRSMTITLKGTTHTFTQS